MVGSIAFGIAAIASYVVPSTGSVLDLAWVNGFTALGAACFLGGALLLLPEAVEAGEDDPESAPDSGRRQPDPGSLGPRAPSS